VSTSPLASASAPIRALPEHGRPHAELLDALRAMHGTDVDWKGGRVFSLVYHAGDRHSAFLKEAHSQFFSENALNPLAFQSLKRMEREVVRMTATMLHGDRNAVGTMTSGGTESLLLAVKTYRDLARKRRPWIRRPNVVLPMSAHPAFDKAGQYFGVRTKKAALGPDNRVDVKKLARLIDRNTVMIAASAPQYPHGVIDPIAELGELARAKGLPFHVDACVGGFLLPFLEKLGLDVPSPPGALLIGVVVGLGLGAHLLVSATLTFGYRLGVEPQRYLGAVLYDAGVQVLATELFFRGALFNRAQRRWPLGRALLLAVGATLVRYLVDPLLPRSADAVLGMTFYVSLLATASGWLFWRFGTPVPGMVAGLGFFAAYRALAR